MKQRTHKTVIAKLLTQQGNGAMGGKSILLVFAEPSGVISYHYTGSMGFGNLSLSNLQVKKPLPIVEYDYDNVKALVKALVEAINTGVEKVVSSKTYEG